MLDVPEVIKECFQRDVNKVFRVSFPNGEHEDITNENIEEESVSFTESLCSRRTLKFGLCEAAVLEFTMFGIENIKGLTIDAGIELCDVSLPEEYANYYIPYGRFIVHSCERQADLLHRKVVAYSNYINSYNTISNFEKAKWEAGFEKQVDYVFNPVHFALCNISKSIFFDMNAFEIGEDISIEEKGGYYHQRGLTLKGRDGRDYHYEIRIYYKMLNLKQYVDSDLMIWYQQGSRLSENVIKEWILDFIKKQNYSPEVERIFERDIDKDLQNSQTQLHVHSYNKKEKMYVIVSTPIENSGLIAPKFNGYHPNGVYDITFPYKAKISTRIDEGEEQQQELQIMEPEDIKAFFVNNSSSDENKLCIPNIVQTAKRIKKETGEYIVDVTQAPNIKDVFEGLLELNGRFLRQGRMSGTYQFYSLQGKAALYPSEDLYPSEELYPMESDVTLNETGHISAWYDDTPYTPYTRITASYTNELDGKESMEVHEAVYEDELELLLSTSFNMSQYEENMGVVFDLSTYNPLRDGMTVYIDGGGLTMDTVDAYGGADPALSDVLFNMDIPTQGATSLEWTADNWQEVKSIWISVDYHSIQEGVDYIIKISALTRTEVDQDHNTLDISDNYLVKTYQIASSDLQEMMKNMLSNISDIQYMPADIKLQGLPYVEVGDTVRVNTMDGGFDTIVLRRTLKGVQALIDNFESKR